MSLYRKRAYATCRCALLAHSRFRYSPRTTQALLPSETISPVGMTFQLTCRDNMGSCVPIRLASYCFIEARSYAGVIKVTHPDFVYQPLFPLEGLGDAGRQR